MAPPLSLSPEELLQLEQQRQGLIQNYALAQAQRGYSSGLLDQQYQQGQAQLGDRFQGMQSELQDSLIRRGIFDSGIAQGDYQELGQDQNEAYGQLAQQYAGQQGQAQLQGTQLELALQQGLQGIDMDRASREAALAAQIQAAIGSAPPPQAQAPQQAAGSVAGYRPQPAAPAPAPAPSTAGMSQAWAPRPGASYGSKGQAAPPRMMAPAPKPRPRRPTSGGGRAF